MMSRDPKAVPAVPDEEAILPAAPEGSPSELAMASRRQRLTGSAVGVGSVGFDESGAFDVGADEHHPENEDEPPSVGPA
jgi:hypothetical protein